MTAPSVSLAPWHIEPLNPAEAPWPLLLSADPSREKVRGYLAGSTCFAARESFQREGQPPRPGGRGEVLGMCVLVPLRASGDRKSTRLNSSHSQISYAVFCLKKKKKITRQLNTGRSKWE